MCASSYMGTIFGMAVAAELSKYDPLIIATGAMFFALLILALVLGLLLGIHWVFQQGKIKYYQVRKSPYYPPLKCPAIAVVVDAIRKRLAKMRHMNRKRRPTPST